MNLELGFSYPCLQASIDSGNEPVRIKRKSVRISTRNQLLNGAFRASLSTSKCLT